MPAATGASLIAHQLDLLCKTGIGIEAIAPDGVALIRQLVGAQAGAIFWMDEQGLPEGFFHEDSPPQVQSLFLDEFERLFVGEREINVFALARHRGRRVGNLIDPPPGYWRSNTLNLLVRPSGHQHALDLRVEVDGRARAVVLLFRSGAQRFGDAQARLLDAVTPCLQRAIRGGGQRLDGQVLASGHVLTDAEGWRVWMHSAPAMAILQAANRTGTGAVKTGELAVLPPFLRPLCAELRASPSLSLEREFAVPGGRLRARATTLLPQAGAGPGSAPHVLIDLALLRPRHLDIVHRVATLRLSPTQREIALLAGMGHARADCLRLVGVSKEALKKHLNAVYATTGANDWDGLRQALAV